MVRLSPRDVVVLLRRAARRAGDLAIDGAALAGAGLIAHGVDLVSRPAAFVVGGCFLLAGSWMTARKAG